MLHQAASSAAAAAEPSRSQLADSCLYVIDTLPLVYRFLPREQLPAARVGPAPDFGEQDAQRPADDPAQSFLGQLLNMTQRNVRKLLPPTHMALVIDVPGATYRHRMYPQYKAHRREHPPSLTEAVCRILAVVDALGIPVLSVPGVEADDVVGTLAVKAQQDGFGSVVIVSTDKDFYQLLSPTVSVLRGGGPYGELYTLADFTQQEQLADPRLWIDIKALMGDSSDNVPGVKGIGAKTAKQLVQSFGTVEQIAQQLAALSEEEQKQVVKLNKQQRAMLLSEDGQVAAAFMKELVTINTQLKAPPCQQPWSTYELKLPADNGASAVERADKLGMAWMKLKLSSYLQRLAGDS